ncbi:hypothetical protein SD1617_0112 [Shigella dysenteriae 1617]|nr:hypothetical protein SD1617_0112 [Shigella dysenteriae 1617]UMW93437.1 hypothetical protein [Escherichia coli]CCE21142.1 hypothetical protein HUS41_pI0123 [Escherichia coli]
MFSGNYHLQQDVFLFIFPEPECFSFHNHPEHECSSSIS